MNRILESRDAKEVVELLQGQDVYDEESFMFAYNIDILNTTELDIRNSLFSYQMIGYASFEKAGNISDILLFQGTTNQRSNSIVRIELLTISDIEFVKTSFNKMLEHLKAMNIQKIVTSIMRRQLNKRNEEVFKELGFQSEVVYSAKDNDTHSDCLTFAFFL
ncbi:MAG: hypothetical protein ACERKZ_03880 [Lachnotalea sp.]